jgi:hypothetical protein
MLSFITVLFGIFLIYLIIDHLKPKYVEGYQMVMPIKFTYAGEPYFTHKVEINKPVNTYYRDAKFNIDIDGLSMEPKMTMNF